ncbi:hypothetical protein C8R46DRAFT_29373 [Mycena filopes]|nr:hypothetical protein C8R46DRAFT_29373 [Mycena filopes]
MPFFENSSHYKVSGGEFNDVHGDMYKSGTDTRVIDRTTDSYNAASRAPHANRGRGGGARPSAYTTRPQQPVRSNTFPVPPHTQDPTHALPLPPPPPPPQGPGYTPNPGHTHNPGYPPLSSYAHNPPGYPPPAGHNPPPLPSHPHNPGYRSSPAHPPTSRFPGPGQRLPQDELAAQVDRLSLGDRRMTAPPLLQSAHSAPLPMARHNSLQQYPEPDGRHRHSPPNHLPSSSHTPWLPPAPDKPLWTPPAKPSPTSPPYYFPPPNGSAPRRSGQQPQPGSQPQSNPMSRPPAASPSRRPMSQSYAMSHAPPPPMTVPRPRRSSTSGPGPMPLPNSAPKQKNRAGPDDSGYSSDDTERAPSPQRSSSKSSRKPHSGSSNSYR